MSQLLRIASLALSITVAACAAPAADDLAGAELVTASGVHLDLWQTEDGWFFHSVAENAEIVLSSEAYTSRTGALGGILAVLEHGALESRYLVTAGADGQHRVALRAGNGETIATTEGYATRSSAERAVRSSAAAIGGYVAAWSRDAGARFEVFEGAGGQFYFRLHAGNGEIMLGSEGYQREAAALNGAFATLAHGVDPEAYVIAASEAGFHLNLRAPNNQVVASSEVYATRDNAERARDAIVELLATIELL